ncbi:MAG: hypothetical protein QME87_14205 [Bacillota bacterium]|nr:hypothetical protein [Bacillota bacterium]
MGYNKTHYGYGASSNHNNCVENNPVRKLLIELRPKRKMAFPLADGSSVERYVSECHISLQQGEGHTPVILGEKDDEALLGVVTLEILGLVFNPFSRTLQPMRMLLI